MVMKMLAKEKSERNLLEFVDIENLVPQNHILRKINKAINFNEIYPIINELYCQDNGRPSIDPVKLCSSSTSTAYLRCAVPSKK